MRREKRKEKNYARNLFVNNLYRFPNTCSHFSLTLPSQNGIIFVIVLEAKEQKVKPFNLDSASVYNAENLATAVFWVLIVDGTKMLTETGTATAFFLHIIFLYPRMFL